MNSILSNLQKSTFPLHNLKDILYNLSVQVKNGNNKHNGIYIPLTHPSWQEVHPFVLTTYIKENNKFNTHIYIENTREYFTNSLNTTFTKIYNILGIYFVLSKMEEDPLFIISYRHNPDIISNYQVTSFIGNSDLLENMVS